MVYEEGKPFVHPQNRVCQEWNVDLGGALVLVQSPMIMLSFSTAADWRLSGETAFRKALLPSQTRIRW